MNKKQLAILLAKRSKSSPNPISREAALSYVESIFELISQELIRPEGYLLIENFGKLFVDRRIKRGRAGALRQGDSDELRRASKISYHLRFSASRHLKERLRENLFLSKYNESD